MNITKLKYPLSNMEASGAELQNANVSSKSRFVETLTNEIFSSDEEKIRIYGVLIRNYVVELQNHLPEFLRQDPEMKAILEVESKEHRVQVEVLKDIFNQMFIESATWGLSLFEKNLGLQPNASDNYEQRRNRILIYLQQHKTVNKQFIEELFSRYVSDDSEIQVVEDNPNNTFWVIDTGGRIIYPDDLREAIETYKPAHLRYGLEMRREIYMDDEGKIRLGFASVFSGYNKILLAAPEGVEYVLNMAIIPARTVLVKVGFEIASSGKLNLKFGSVAGVFGRKEIAVDVDDLPDAFKERDSYLTLKFGIIDSVGGVKKIQTETPKDSVFNIGYALKVVKSYVRKYGLDPPESSNLNVGFGAKITHNGERKIDASLDDLPEEFKEKNSYVSIRVGSITAQNGFKKISAKIPDNAKTKLFAGANLAVTGYKVIGADLSDLSPTKKKRFHVGISHVGSMAVG